MGFFQHLGDDFKSIFMDDFEVGVESMTDVPVIYMDPKDFNVSLEGLDRNSPTFVDDAIAKNITDQDIQKFRDSLEEQRPGFTDELTDRDLSEGILLSAMQGPFAAQMEHNGEKVCVVNKLSESFDEKHEIAHALAHLDEDELTSIPGNDSMWQRAIGIHEGTHCNQDFNEAANPELADAATLTRESEADLSVYEYFEWRGEDDFVQAMKDYRAIGASNDPTHATTALVDDEIIHATPDHIDAADKALSAIVITVQEHLGYSSPSEVATLATENPEEFINTVNNLVDNGAYDANPILKEYVEDIVDAVDRQLINENKPNEPKSENIQRNYSAEAEYSSEASGEAQTKAPPTHRDFNHSDKLLETQAPIIIHGNTKDRMEINGISPSEFFNKQASPVQQTSEPETSLEQHQENTITQPSYSSPTFG